MKLFGYIRAAEAELTATCPACFRDSTGASRVVACHDCGSPVPDVPLGIDRQRQEINAYAARTLPDARRGPVAWEIAETPGDVLAKLLSVMGADDVLIVVNVARLWPTAKTFNPLGCVVRAIAEGVDVGPDTGAGDWWPERPRWRNNAKPGDGCEWCCRVCEASGTVTWLPMRGTNCHVCQTPKAVCAVPRPHAGMRDKMARMAALRSSGESPVRIAAILDSERVRDNWGRTFGRASVDAWLAAWNRINGSEEKWT